MIDFQSLEQQCPSCHGHGRIENPKWAHFWKQHDNLKNWFRSLNTEEQLTIAEKMLPEEPAEPMFFLCKLCHGRGKTLTSEGENLIRFVRFWTNPNY